MIKWLIQILIIPFIFVWYDMYSQNDSLYQFSKVPLFKSDSIIDLDFYVNLKSLIKDNGYNASYHDLKIVYRNEYNGQINLKAEVKRRGRFRIKIDNCNYPPLMLRLNKSNSVVTVFEGLNKVKLVTQCQSNQIRFESYMLREYSAYRIYNIITHYSYKVRLVRINYIDILGDDTITNFGFFIEPLDILSERLAGTVYTRNIHPNTIDHRFSAYLFVYQFLIGNTDWTLKNQHHITLIETALGSHPIPIPFDLDFAGLVNAPYALPAEQLPISSVKERYYYGYCRSNKEIDSVLINFLNKKNAIYQLVSNFVYLSAKEKHEILNYFDQFYRIIESPKKIKKEFVKKCRTD